MHHFPRCKVVFELSDLLHDHIATGACNIEIGPLADGITAQIKEWIQCRKKSHRGQSEFFFWKDAYRILFSGDNPPNPCKLLSIWSIFNFGQAIDPQGSLS